MLNYDISRLLSYVLDAAGHISSTRLMVPDMFQTSSDGKRVITTWNDFDQPVGAAAGLLAGFLGEIARMFQDFPIIYENWKAISGKKKTEFYDQKIKVLIVNKTEYFFFYLMFILLSNYFVMVILQDKICC
jgi:hypothetical protein